VSPLPAEAIGLGLTDCTWPGRLEWLRVPGGELLIDAAHNPAGAAALADYLRASGAAPLPIVLAVMQDKDIEGIARAIVPVAASLMATTVEHPRARSAESLAASLRPLAPAIRVDAEPSPERAVSRALADGGRAAAAGSIFLIGPLRAALLAGGGRPA
jgi:dihydrofolate synthase/folylpolyglutamate synthase